MHTNVTITADEFKTIHNALFYLDCGINELKNVVLETHIDKLQNAAKSIRDALKNAYMQEDQVFNRSFNHYSKVQEDHNYDSVWSYYDVDDLYSNHPYTNVKALVYQGILSEIKGPRWIDIYDAADRVINDSKDMHHIFIESFVPDVTEKEKVETLSLVTGS